MTEYLTLADSLRLNAARHRANAMQHMLAGRMEWAMGSHRKAERNERRADELEDLSLQVFLAGRAEALAARIANSILHGSVDVSFTAAASL